jgi:hypothetical protein
MSWNANFWNWNVPFFGAKVLSFQSLNSNVNIHFYIFISNFKLVKLIFEIPIAFNEFLLSFLQTMM